MNGSQCSENSFKRLELQLETISNAMKNAEDINDEINVETPEIGRAIGIVESFLKRKHRLCYGGQAINAHLPQSVKFYNKKKNVPDYDFFTPDKDGDISIIVSKLRNKGFTEIYVREGMHSGTFKVFVNFIGVADVTYMDTSIYNILYKRRAIIEGISYLDANMLRMLMYVELSRPRGEVSRWPKVFERLILLNKFIPMPSCFKKTPLHDGGRLSQPEIKTIMTYIIHHERVFAGAALRGLYSNYLKQKKSAGWIMRNTLPIYLFSQDSENDAKFFVEELSTGTYTNIKFPGDFMPPLKVLFRGGVPILIIIEQTACHSYYSIPISREKPLRVASLDTLISLFFNLSLNRNHIAELSSLECLAQELIEISCRARLSPDLFPFPFISIDCSGHQKSKPSLIRERIRRRIRTAKTGDSVHAKSGRRTTYRKKPD